MNSLSNAGVRLAGCVLAVCIPVWMSGASAATTWLDVRPVVATRGIATDGSLYVSAAGNGIWTSSDLKTWQRASLPAGAGPTYNDVIWDGSRFIAVGDGVISSTDGSHWSLVSVPDAAAHFWSAITVLAGTYVVVGSGGTEVLRSTDAVTWNLVSTGVFADPSSTISLQGVGTNGSNLFVASGYETATSGTPTQGDVVLTSPDGQTWTQQTLPNHGLDDYNAGFTNNVAWNSTIFVTGGGNGLYTSPDGVTWTALDFTTILPPNRVAWIFGRIAFLNGQFVAVGADIPSSVTVGDNQIAVFTSSNGTTWASHDLAALQSSYYGLSGVAYTGSQYVAAGSQAAYSSSDASTWTLQSSGTQTNLSTCIFQGAGKDVVPGDGGTVTSSDGTTWPATPVSYARVFAQTGNGCGAYGNGHYVTLFSQGVGEVFSSTDGTTWVDSPTTTDLTFQSVAWNGSEFLAIGYGTGTNRPAAVDTSPDGGFWAPVTPTGFPSGPVSFAPPGGLIYANGQFVTWGTAAGAAFIAASADGLAWRQASVTGLPAGATILSVAFGSGAYLALADESDGTSLVFSSSDGLKWTAVRGNIPKETWTTLIWGNQEFMAVGVDPTTGQGVAAQGNAAGTSWQTAQLQDSPQLNDVIWDGGKYIAVSDYDIVTLAQAVVTSGGGGGGSGGGSGGGASSGGSGAFDILALSLLSGLAIRRRERWMKG